MAWAWNQEGTEKLVNGKQHFIWYVPSGMNGPPQNVHLNFWLEFLKSDLTIYLPSRILEIFCQMVSTLVVCPINRVLLKIVCIFPLSGLLSEFCSFGYGLKDHFSLTQVKCHIWLTSNKSDDVTSGTRTWFQKVSYRQWRNECLWSVVFTKQNYNAHWIKWRILFQFSLAWQKGYCSVTWFKLY